MQVKHTTPSPTQAVLTVVASESELTPIKEAVITKLGSRVKIAGFREGKAPQELIEKQLDQSMLQSEFLEEAINQIYPAAIRSEKLRPVDRPDISIKKFVPFTVLEFEAKMPIIGPVKLADYKKIKLARPKVDIKVSDVNEVIESLRSRLAEKKDVERAAKNGDQVWIDFKGTDSKGQSIKGADGDNYPLVIGSNTFITGFEPKMVGLKAGEETKFTLTFPKDYGVKSMASKKVTFAVTVVKVQEVVLPSIDDEFAAKAGPFKTLAELKADIKKQVTSERELQSERDYESELVQKISDKSEVAIPEILIDEQVDRLFTELQNNLVYQGQTIQEFLDIQGMDEKAYRAKVLAPQAEARVKAGIVLTEISERENLTVTNQEVGDRIAALKSQYQDEKMRAELDKPESQNEIASRILTEKTVGILKRIFFEIVEKYH